MSDETQPETDLLLRVTEEKTFTNYLKSITTSQIKKFLLIILIIGGFSYFIGLGIGAYDYLLTNFNEKYFIGYYSVDKRQFFFLNTRTGELYPRSVLLKESYTHGQQNAAFSMLFSIFITSLLALYYGYVTYLYQDHLSTRSYYYSLSFDEKYGIHLAIYNKRVLTFKQELLVSYPPLSSKNGVSIDPIIQIYHDLKIFAKPLWERYAFAEAVDIIYPLNPRFIDLIKTNDQKLIPKETSDDIQIEKAKLITHDFTDITHEPKNAKYYLIPNFFFFTQNVAILLWVGLFTLFYFRAQPLIVTTAFDDILRDTSITIFTFDLFGAVGFLLLGRLFYSKTVSKPIKRDVLIMQGVLATWIIITLTYRIISGIFPAVFNPKVTGTAFLKLILESPLHFYSGYFFILSSYLFVLFIFTLKHLYQTMSAYSELSHYKLQGPWSYYMYSLFLGITLIAVFTAFNGLDGLPKSASQDSLLVFFGRILKFIVAPSFASALFLNSFKEFLSKDLLYKKNTKA